MREVQIITHVRLFIFVQYEVIVVYDGITVERRMVDSFKIKRLPDGTYLFKSPKFSVVADTITRIPYIGRTEFAGEKKRTKKG